MNIKSGTMILRGLAIMKQNKSCFAQCVGRSLTYWPEEHLWLSVVRHTDLLFLCARKFTVQTRASTLNGRGSKIFGSLQLTCPKGKYILVSL
jgi:hypothetical protein